MCEEMRLENLIKKAP